MLRTTIAFYLIINSALAVASAAEKEQEISTINANNYQKLGYSVEVQVPNPSEPDFKNFYIKFPKKIGQDFNYSYSISLYSESGKKLIYYRPEAILERSDITGEYYILANETITPCLGLTNIYSKSGNYGFHPPQRSIQIDLSSFLKNNSGQKQIECKK